MSLTRDSKAPKGKPDFVVSNENGGFFTKDPDFFKSIFVPIDGLAGMEAEEKARAQYEAHEWQKKVVVDDTTWYTPKDGAGKGPVNKAAHSILHDAPQKRSIKALYRSKRPLVSVMPTTIFPDSTSNFDFLAFLRPSKPDEWVATNELTGEPVDFLLHWARDKEDFFNKPGKAPPQQPKPLSAEELGNSAIFGRASGGTQPMNPRVVPHAEFFGES